MLIEELSREESIQDRCSNMHQVSNWNGREIQLLGNERPSWNCLKVASGSQSAGASAIAEIDKNGNSNTKVEGHYEYKHSTESGLSQSVKVQGEANVDDKGNASGKAQVSYDVKF